jgi:hypothetical protein
VTGDRKFYKLSTDGESASLAKDQPIQQLNGGRIRVDINGVPYADYNIENDLSNISIPIKNGDSIGVTCLSLNSGSRFVSFHVVCNVGPIDSGPLYEGERKAWTISTGSSDYTKELPWLRLEAEKGNPVAEDALGYIYQHGLGVMKNTSEAVIWYKRSADHGNINALERLKNLVK